MAVVASYSSFDLHQAGKSASDTVRDGTEIQRGTATTATNSFTDTNRDLDAEGLSGAAGETLQIIEGGGNIIREEAISGVGGVGNIELTVGGAAFDGTENNLQYRAFKAPTSAEIIAGQSKRGRGLAGYVELLNAIEATLATTLLLQAIDVAYAEGNTQQTVTYDDT